MTDCIFCKIVQGDMKADVVYEDDDVIAFRDINPQAPTHVVIIPREHIATINDIQERHAANVGKLFLCAKKVALDEGVEDGYRVAMNCGERGGQHVFHIHLHLLGGRRMKWPPG